MAGFDLDYHVCILREAGFITFEYDHDNQNTAGEFGNYQEEEALML